jgi:hypothetical protein
LTHATKLLIAVREIRPRKPRPPAPKPKRAPHAWNAARILGLMFAPPPGPPPKKNPRRGVVPVPVVPVPVVPVPVVPVPVPPPAPPEPPGGGPLPAGRAGNVTPCAFRHATSWVRLALPVVLPPLPVVLPPLPPVEAEAVVPLDELVELLLALPHAASRPPAAMVASAIATRLDPVFNTAFLS